MPNNTPKPPLAACRRAMGVALVSCALVVTSVSGPATAAPVAGGTVATPATLTLPTAALAKPKVAVMPATKMITVSWTAVPKATQYIVQYSTSRSFPKSSLKSVRTTAKVRKITGLKNNTVYYVRVRAVKGKTYSPWTVVSARPSTNSPRNIEGVKITRAGTNKVRVTWKAPATAEYIWVEAHWDSDCLKPESPNYKYRWKTAKLPGTTTTTVLTVPAAYVPRIGSNSGNAVFARVFAVNAGNERRHITVNGYASVTKPVGTAAQKVSVATYNVESIPSTENMPGHRWTDRRTAVKNSIVYANADVVGIQEAGSRYGTGPRQFEELGTLLAPSGYALAMSGAQVPIGDGTLVKDSHILYKSSRVQLLDAGMQSMKALNPAGGWNERDSTVIADRYMAWAKLKSRTSGATFYVASVHLPQGTASALVTLRKNVIKGIESFMAKKAGSLPVIVMGDLNTYLWDYPDGPDTYMVSKGWQSAAATTSFKGWQYPTSVGTDLPSKPYVNDLGKPGRRIDHIFSKNASGVYSYVNQVILNSNGTFNENYRGSDHNLQKAVISIR